MSWSRREELTVKIVVQKLGEEDYVALAECGPSKDRFRGTEPENAFRTACDWAAHRVQKDDPPA
jgi:hypothetical protein